jgi:Na+-transporting NADH:ubiquinone oxidoreductase subunit F
MLIAFLIAVGVVCAITTLLAVLMVVGDATIANYGDVTISINGTKEIQAEGGKNLLSTLKEKEIFIPSACGGRGSCGLCKLRVLEGAGDMLPTEQPWLSADEQKNNVRLACQIKVKRRLRIEIPEALFKVKQYKARVTAIRDLTYDIKEIKLRLVDPPELDFTPGAFIQFEVPPYELTDEPVYRAYSVSSDPGNRNELELEIRYIPHGICTTYVHKHLKAGDEVVLNGPYGEFKLHPSDRKIVFIAGGSGMAPIKAMLHDMAKTRNPRRTRYFFGARAVRDLFLVDEMKALETVLPDFKFIPALSAPAPGDRWDGETGLITEVVDRHLENGENTEAYLCGSPLMIDACIEALRKKGIPDSLIYYDKFS